MIEMKETATKAMNEGTSHQTHRTGPGRDRMLSSKRVSLSSGTARPLLHNSYSSSLSSLSPKLAGLQAKLVVGPADDEYEREADRVAEQAASMPQTPVQRACSSCQEDEPVQREPLSARITPLIQRQKAEEENEEKLQASPMIQRQIGEEEEEEKIQTAPEMAGSKGGPAGPELEQSLEQARGGGRPLAEGFRSRMESAFGADFSSVRIHADEPADRLSRSIQARAFTRGHDIFLRQGEYQPASTDGQRLLAHELTHVVQQGQQHIRPIKRTMDGGQSKEYARLIKVGGVIEENASAGRFESQKKIKQDNSNATLQKFSQPSIVASDDIIQRQQRVTGEFLPPTPIGRLNAEGNPLKCHFEVKARFDLVGENIYYRFGQYRQYIRGVFRSGNKVKEHYLNDGPMQQDQWTEDKIGTARYGYRVRSQGLFSDDAYGHMVNRDNGRYYSSEDTPQALKEDTEMDLQFRGILIDTGDGNRIIAERLWSIYGRNIRIGSHRY